MITQYRLKELLHYCHETGGFTWRVSTSNMVKVGAIAGTMEKQGYVRIRVDGKCYAAHRLAWLYANGHFPPEQLDHINRVRNDNRLCNLRLATNAENQQNMSTRKDNTTGHVGVRWHSGRQKWESRISINKKPIQLGTFTDISEAISARKSAEQKYHPFNSRVTA